MSRATLVLLVALVHAIAGPALAATQRAQLTDIEDEVMCPICGTALNLSQAPQADRERALIRRLIAAGRTKEQIKATLVAQYGPRVLATPSDHGFDLAAWIVPILGFGLGAAVIAASVRRWHRQPDRRGQGTPTPLQGRDADRLKEDLGRYDL